MASLLYFHSLLNLQIVFFSTNMKYTNSNTHSSKTRKYRIQSYKEKSEGDNKQYCIKIWFTHPAFPDSYHKKPGTNKCLKQHTPSASNLGFSQTVFWNRYCNKPSFNKFKMCTKQCLLILDLAEAVSDDGNYHKAKLTPPLTFRKGPMLWDTHEAILCEIFSSLRLLHRAS
jgi:hypothetical protein